jgi:FkbM family methyltransferase
VDFFRTLALRLTGLTPGWLKAYVYRRPALLGPLAGFIKKIVPLDHESVVVISAGPNRGLRLAIDRSVPNYFWLNPDYEPALQAAFNASLRPGQTVADVGAHMGFDTLHFARLVGPGGHVHAFEPDPANGRKLRRNCELNALDQVSVHLCAVSDRRGTARFLAHGTTTSRVATAAEPATVEVPTVTLDETLAPQGSDAPIDLIKVDVEGWEVEVLRGSTRILREKRPVWLIEIHSAAALAQCFTLLVAAGYRVESLTPGSYYAAALDSLAHGAPLPVDGFDVGHIRALPQ